MKNKLSINEQKGFTLIAISILSAMAGIVVISTLKENVIQERLSGNFEKSTSARLTSERGLFESFDTLNRILAENPEITLPELIAASSTNGVITGAADSNYVSSLTSSGNYLQMTTNSSINGGASSIGSSFALQGGSKAPAGVFRGGVTACEKIVVRDGGNVDSYDSSKGDYHTSTNQSDDLIVRTLNENSVIELQGTGKVDGDIISPNSIELSGKTEVTGDVFSNGYIDLSGETVIGGSVYAYKYYSQKRGRVKGSIYANEYISMLNPAVEGSLFSGGKVDLKHGIVAQDVVAKGAVTKSLTLVGGDIYQHGARVIDKVKLVEVDDGYYDPADAKDVACDPLNIKNEIDGVENKISSDHELLVESDSVYKIEQKSGPSSAGTISSKQATFLGKSVEFLSYDKVSITQPTLEVATNSDVYIYVKGDFTLKGEGKINIPKSSSLTLVLQGKFEITGNAQISGHGMSDNGKPSLSIYSAHSGSGMSIKGSESDMYAAIYAPLTDIEIASGKRFKGSVHGSHVSIEGGSGVHFDTHLRSVTSEGGGVTTPPRLVFNGLLFTN